MDIITILVIGITCLISFVGFENRMLFDKYKFSTYGILNLKQIDRLLSSGFLHADLMHLLFNMFTLYVFSGTIIQQLGNLHYIIIYLVAILGGNLLTLWMYRRDMTYTAIGASGGVSGIVFATVALYPQMTLMIFPIPIPIYGWIYAILYLIYSVYSMRNSIGNIGHAAHLGGAVVGFIGAIISSPQIIYTNGYFLALISIPLIGLAYFVYKEK
ncbi:MAG: hypothetical protein RL662_1357 [Bacteroidota bacterium]